MANKIYLKTHDGLSTLVSSRAASRMLDSALRAKGHSSETVNQSQMREVLLGPVFKELRTILPSDGVERSLKLLINELKRASQVAVAVAEKPQPAAESLGFVTAELHPVIAVTEDAVLHTELELPVPEAVPATVVPLVSLAELQVESEAAIAVTSELEQASDVTISVRQSAALVDDMPEGEAAADLVNVTTEFSLTEAELEGVLVTFAKLEYVRMVAAIHPSGEVALSRGSGFDVAALSRLSLTSMRLLERSGQLRSYYLAYSEGQLFIFPLGTFTLIVIGTVDVNLGSVFATLTKLKEGV